MIASGGERERLIAVVRESPVHPWHSTCSVQWSLRMSVGMLFCVISRVGIPLRFSAIRIQRSCRTLCVNFMNYWALNKFALASITHKQMVWSNDLIALWKLWFGGSFTRMPKIGINGCSPCCAVWRIPQSSMGFPTFELLYGRRPHRVIDVLRRVRENHLAKLPE